MLMTSFNTRRQKISNENATQTEKVLAIGLNYNNLAMNLFWGEKLLFINTWLKIGMFFTLISFHVVYKGVRARVIMRVFDQRPGK